MDVRKKKFIKVFKLYQNNEFYDKIKNLYINRIYKTIKTVESIFKKIKYTKKNVLYKTSLKVVDDINTKYDTILSKQKKYKFTGQQIFNKINNIKPVEAYDEDLNQINYISFIDFRTIFLWPFFRKYFNNNDASFFKFTLKYNNKANVDTYYYQVPKSNGSFNKYFEKFYWDFMALSDEFKLNAYSDEDVLIIEPYKQVQETKLIQAYLKSNKGHCFLDPIKRYFKKMYKKSKSTMKKRILLSSLTKINKYYDIYKNGVEEDKINSLCEDLNINIKISFSLPLKEYTIFECLTNKTPLKLFKFINNKIDHVNQLSDFILDKSNLCKDSIIKVDLLELEKIYKNLQKNNINCIYKKKNNNIIEIHTPSVIYNIEDDEYKKAVSKFEKQYNINMFCLDYIKNNEVCNFINRSVHFNTSCQFENEKLNININHIDQVKAYTQFKKCNYYCGFPAKITDFRKCNKDFSLKNIGFYLIDNIKFNNLKFERLNENMNLYINNNVYPSSDLLLLNDYADFNVIGGCWGSSFDFDFSEDMINNKIDDIRFYAKYTGVISSYNEYNEYFMQGDEKYFENIASVVDPSRCQIFKNHNTDEVLIKYKKDKINYKCHIASFILSYQRINMINQLMEMNINNIIRVVTDGVYYYDHKFKLLDDLQFRVKEVDNINKKAFLDNHQLYLSNIRYYLDEEPITYNFSDFVEHEMIMHKIGAGGTGKTTETIDKGYINLLYVAPSWKLSTKMKNEHKIDVTVLIRTILDNDESNYFLNKYSVIIFDEISQYTQNIKLKILDKFRYHKIIFIGDIGFQLSNFFNKKKKEDLFNSKTQFKINDNENLLVYDKVYRFKCNKLLRLCQNLRNIIYTGSLDSIDKKLTFDIEKINKLSKIPPHIKTKRNNKIIELINNYISNNYKENFISLNKMNYNHLEDIILTSKNKCNEHHLMSCNCDGLNYSKQWNDKYAHLEKYITTTNNKEHTKGQVIFNKNNNCRLCHAFTIHAIQGETIKTGKIYIDMRDIFCPEMLYTAISRAERLDQIFFI